MPMMALIALAGAGAVILPEPAGDRKIWLRPDDIPQEEFENGRDGGFLYRVLVAPDGKVDACEVKASGAPRSDWTAFCSTVKKRYAYRNVTAPSGAPTYYLMHDNVAYVLPSSWVWGAMAQAPDMVIDLASRPPGAEDGKLKVPVNIAVDAKGALQQCDAPAGSKQASLAKVACQQLKGSWTPMPEKNAQGQAVAYVREMRVEFRGPNAG